MKAFVQMEHLACTLDQLRLMVGRIQHGDEFAQIEPKYAQSDGW